MTAAVCSRRFSSGGKPVDARRQHRLHRGRHLDTRERLGQAVGPLAADQHLRFHQGAHTLLQEERVALGALDQALLERREAGVVPQQGVDECLGRCSRGNGSSRSCSIVGLTAPVVSILRAIGDEQEEVGGREALDQGVEHRLGLGIDPVQVLDDEQQGLHLAFPQQDALERVQGALAALGGLERLPRRVLDRHIEQRQERWRGGREGVIEAAEVSGHLVADRRQIIAVVEVEVALEQVDDRAIGGGLAVGGPLRLQDQPRLRQGATDELVAQA